MSNLTLLFATFLLSTTTVLTAQEGYSDLKDFKIAVEIVENGIKLTCENGCAWKELRTSLKNHKPQAINSIGMTTLDDNSSIKDISLADFLITVTKTSKGIELKGIKGTAWIELAFSLKQNQPKAFNQNGMATGN
jgi:hypothetical protein